MAVEQVKAFMAKVKEDQELVKKLADAQAAYKGNDGIAEVVIPVAKEAGFDFTVEDFKAVATPQGEQLSEDELDKVAGGKLCWSDMGTDQICYDEHGVKF